MVVLAGAKNPLAHTVHAVAAGVVEEVYWPMAQDWQDPEEDVDLYVPAGHA